MVTIASGGEVSVSADFLAVQAEVRAEVHAQPLTGTAGSPLVSDTLVAEFDAKSLATGRGEASDFESVLRFNVPVPADRGGHAVAPYDISRCIVTVYDADNPNLGVSLTLFAPCVIEEVRDGERGVYSRLVVTLSRETVRDVIGKATTGALAAAASVYVRVETTAMSIGDRFISSGISIKHWDESADDGKGAFGEFVAPPADQRVVVFLHGWQTLQGIERGNLGDTRDLHPDIETWQALAAYATGHVSDYKSRFEFYTVRYDSDHSIYDNAVDIQALLASRFPGRQVAIVAHSMGGLVAHAMMRRYHPEGRAYVPWDGGVARLITLDSPLHGTPVVQIVHRLCRTRLASSHGMSVGSDEPSCLGSTLRYVWERLAP